MIPNLIGLTGRAGAGKDAVASQLGALYGYERIAFADALKAAAYDADPMIEGRGDELSGRGSFRMIRLAQLVDLGGWDEAKTLYPDVRRYLQRFGVAMRDQAPGIWVNIAASKIARLRGAGSRVVVTDVRFADEVDAIRSAGGIVVRIDRPGGGLAGVNAAHVSEQVDALDVDLVVANDGPIETLATVAAHVHSGVIFLGAGTFGPRVPV